MPEKNIIISAPFAASFKNLIINEGFIFTLSKHYKVYVLTSLPQEEIKRLVPEKILRQIFIFRHDFPKANVDQSLTSFISSYAFNKKTASKTSQIKEQSYKLTPFMKLIRLLVKFVAIFTGWNKIYRMAEKRKYQIYADPFINGILKKIKPELIFCSAITFEPDYFTITEGKRLQIPMVGMVHSWDNLSAKGPFYTGINKVLVWNEFQKREVLNYYGAAMEDKVKVVGMPQADLLHDNIGKDSTVFKKTLGIQKDVLLLTYTTGTPTTIHKENEVVKLIYSNLKKKLNDNWHLHVRLHPKDSLSNYSDTLKGANISFEEINDSNYKARDGRCFTSKGIEHYAMLLKSSDVVLDIASTVTLESLAVGTPVIHIGIDPKKVGFFKSNRRFYEYDHIKYLNSFKAVPVAKDVQALIGYIREIVSNKNYHKNEREQLVQAMLGPFDGKSGEKLAKTLINIRV